MVEVYTRCTRIFGPSILAAPYSSIGWRGRGGSIHLQTNTHDYMSVRPVNTTHSVIILPHFSGLFPRVAEDKISAICSAQPTVNCAHYTFWIFPQPNAISVATSHTTSSSVSRHVTYETIKWRSVLTSSEMSRKQKLWQLETGFDGCRWWKCTWEERTVNRVGWANQSGREPETRRGSQYPYMRKRSQYPYMRKRSQYPYMRKRSLQQISSGS